MFAALFSLILGCAFLWKGSDWLVDSASVLARRFGVSPMLIGLTVVAFGTSLPELVVAVMATVNGQYDLILGNVMGSNIANVLLILGTSAIVFPIAYQRSIFRFEMPINVAAVLLLFAAVMCGDTLQLSTWDGAVLLLGFVFFLVVLFRGSKADAVGELETSTASLSRTVFYCVLGVLSLAAGGKWVTDSAMNLARFWGMSEAFIALFMVAIGTSLPEWVTCINAALKRETDIIMGNVLGSNIFNIFLVLGVSVLLRPIPFAQMLFLELKVLLLTTAGLMGVMALSKQRVLGRVLGLVMALGYGVYLYCIFLRG